MMQRLLLAGMILFLTGTNYLIAQPDPVSFTNRSDLISGAGSGTNDCAVDMNGDYLDDIVRVQSNGIRIYFQRLNGTFSNTFFPASFSNSPNWSICAGDMDDNGFNDLLFGGGSAVSFVMANSDGTSYTEYMQSDYIFSQRSTFFDIDNDGDLDAFVCHDVDLSHPYRNVDGLGTMVEDQDLIHTVNLPGNYAAIWVDYNNDGLGDLYITKCRGGAQPGNPARTNAMYRNNGDGSFTEVGEAINMADNAQSWATVFEDFDNDGDFDAFIVNHDFANRFMLNDGLGNYTDIIESTGIPGSDLGAWENAAADFNNDGFVDILSELNNSLYLNNGDLTFTGQDLSFDEGGIGDFNNDGFLDVVNGGNLWINNGNGNNWVKFNTQGLISNRNGIGCRIEIYGAWGRQIREVRAGQSFSPMSSLATHFGLGEATAIDSVVVKWPSGLRTVYESLDINSTHTLYEANCTLPAATIEVLGTTAICEGETTQLAAPAGFESILWSTGDTNPSLEVSEPGTYGLVLFDEDGCASIANNVIISRITDTAPVIEVEGDLEFCAGSSVTLRIPDGQNPVWSNGANTLSIEVAESGTYNVVVDAQCSDEALTAEESITVEVYQVDAPVVENIDINSDGVAVITATGDNLVWFDMQTGGTNLGTGNNFMTVPLEETTTFYVESAITFGGGTQAGVNSLPMEQGACLP
ncbi:MAG: FG-GAP-like repeat-containing protein [Saprospiraceae bacterium]